MPDLLCAGLIAVDLVFEMADFPAKGLKNRAIDSRLITGGGALNAASAIAGLGGTVALAGNIGDDDFAGFLRRKMRERRIDDRFVRTVPGVPTSRSANFVTPDGGRTVVNHRDDALGSLPFSLPSGFRFDAAVVDTRWPAAATEIAAVAERLEKPVIVDAEAPVEPATDALRLATHIAFSEQGLRDFAGSGDAAGLAKAARGLGKWCAVTRGAGSVFCHDGHSLTEVSAFPSRAVNTLGAGDAWHGAFALALSRGRDETGAVAWANAAASLFVARPIHAEITPTGADVDALLAEPVPGT